MGVGIGKFLNDVGVCNILDRTLDGLGTCLHLAGWLLHCVTLVD